MNDSIKYKLLVVDDEIDIEAIFEVMFSDLIDQQLFDYHYFSSGQKCLEYIETEKHPETIFLILSDINMPQMDGYGLLQNIKKKYPELTVYMVSAYSEDEYIDKAKNLGASDYVVKPVNFDILKNKLVKELTERKEKLAKA